MLMPLSRATPLRFIDIDIGALLMPIRRCHTPLELEMSSLDAGCCRCFHDAACAAAPHTRYAP